MKLFIVLRYAFRTLRKDPAFTLIGLLVLALGIGANTAIFSIVNAVLLRPFPFSNAGQLVAVDSLSKRGDTYASYPDFQDFRARNHSFRHLVAYHEDSWALTVPGAQAVNLSVAVVSADVFPMLGVQPLFGRVFLSSEDEDQSGPMGILISANTWRTRFGSDPKIIGRPITLRGLRYTVIGVMPGSFNFPIRNKPFDAWATFGFSDYLRSPVPWPHERTTHFLDLAGELKPGVSIQQASSDLGSICADLARTYPVSNKYRTVRVQPLLNRVAGKQRPIFLLLLAAVACVLLIACGNIANVSLARVNLRRRELAIRAAMGAGRARLMSQVLAESLLLSLLGGVAGLTLGVFGARLLAHFSPVDIPRIGDSKLDAAVFFFALAASILTGILFGTVPAYRASQFDPADVLREGGRGSTEGGASSRLRSALIVSEAAMSLILLASAGLLIRSLVRLNHVDPGFAPHNVVTTQLSFPASRFNEIGFSQAMNLLETRLRQLPDVVSASDVAILPLGGDSMRTSFEIDGRPVPKSEQPSTRANIIAPGYLQTMGIPLLAGRDISPTDTGASTRVILVNKAFAQQFFNGDAIGKRIRSSVGTWGEKVHPLRQIVGVVGSVAQDSIGQKSLPEIFLPRDQVPFDFATLVVKTRSDPRTILPLIESTLRPIDANIPLGQIHTLEELVSRSTAQPRFLSFLLLVFAGVALLLTAVGLYGVIDYSVSQRTHEIGTRRALGASEESILTLILVRGFVLTMAGIAIGLVATLALSRLISSLLFEVTATDPLTLIAVTVLVLAVGLLASFVPSWRAVRIDPIAALRYE